MINDELTRIETAKSDIIQSVEGKGVQIPDGTKIDKLNVYIDEINQGSGGASVQSDWNENDETNSAFIKNRPFFREFKELEIMPKQSVEITGGEDAIPCEHVTKLGEEVIVEFDGISYKITMSDFRDNLLGGNLSIAGIGTDTGEPFLLMYNTARDAWGMMCSQPGSHTIRMVAKTEILKQIDKQFVPNMTVTIDKDFDLLTDGEWKHYAELFKSGVRLLYDAESGVHTILGFSIDKGVCYARSSEINFYVRGKMARLLEGDVAQFNALTNGVGANYIYLRSPDGKAHGVSVSNDGQLIVE